jgi:hypothetical protein
MPNRRKAPRKTDEIQLGRVEQEPTVVRLARGDPKRLEESLQAFFGDLAHVELGDHMKRLQEREDEILAWLLEQPSNLDAFVRDPLSATRTRFPELELPRGRKPFVPAHVKLELALTEETDPVVLELFQKVWQYAATSASNATAFETAPFSVIATVGATYPKDKVDQVTRAFEAVFGVHRLETIAGVLNVAFERAGRR